MSILIYSNDNEKLTKTDGENLMAKTVVTPNGVLTQYKWDTFKRAWIALWSVRPSNNS